MSTVIAAISIVAAVAIAEVVLASKWNRAYFTIGVPIFSRRVDRHGLSGISLDQLQQSSKTATAAPLMFRQLGPDVIAFREEMFGQYLPIMRGVIRHDPAEAAVSVKGLLNWFVLAAAAVLVVTLGRDVINVLPYFFAVFGILYFIQAVRYNRVAKQLRAAAANS
jgi:hypothetical protein